MLLSEKNDTDMSRQKNNNRAWMKCTEQIREGGGLILTVNKDPRDPHSKTAASHLQVKLSKRQARGYTTITCAKGALFLQLRFGLPRSSRIGRNFPPSNFTPQIIVSLTHWEGCSLLERKRSSSSLIINDFSKIKPMYCPLFHIAQNASLELPDFSQTLPFSCLVLMQNGKYPLTWELLFSPFFSGWSKNSIFSAQ